MLSIRQLTPLDAASVRTLRLSALRESPTAFGKSYDEEIGEPLTETEKRLANNLGSVLLGAFINDALVGTVGIRRESMQKLAHKAGLWGMYVAPPHRGHGVARQLVTEALAVAATLTPLTGALQDCHNLILGAITMNIAQKSYFEGKIYMCPAGGGVNPFIAISGVFTAPLIQAASFGQNGVPDPRARNNFWGGITIPHNQNFLVRYNWSAALTLAGGNTAITTYLDGYLYRRVL